MPKIALTEGAYTARSLIANAQRCVNLYPEKNTADAPFPFTYYQTPGITVFGVPPAQAVGRGTYIATNGVLFSVVGRAVYTVSAVGVFTQIGTINAGITPVSMMDNGLCLVIVDGSKVGWVYDLQSKFSQINDPNFLGATKVDYLDTFFIFNVPGTNQWYYSLSNATYAMLAGGGVAGGVIAAGSGYGPQAPVIFAPANFSNITTGVTNGNGSVLITGGVITSTTVSYAPGSWNVGDSVNVGLAGGGVTGLSITNAGSGYTNGAYVWVPLNGGGGEYLYVNIVVSGGAVTGVSIVGAGTLPGVGYQPNDALAISGHAPAGLLTGSLAAFKVLSVASTGSGFVGTVASVGPVTLNILNGGSGYPFGALPAYTYADVPLTGGSGTGATAAVVVANGAQVGSAPPCGVGAVTVVAAGSGYAPGDQLSASLTGSIVTGTVAGGGGYTPGNYVDIALLGGSGSGAVAGVVVNGSGVVTTITVNASGVLAGTATAYSVAPGSSPGIGYAVGDVLSFILPNGAGSGASFTVQSITATGTGFAYQINTVAGQGFNALNIASKTGYADTLQTLAVMHREIWLFGQYTTEVWYNAGTPDFAFGIMAGVYVEQGCAAPYSVSKYDLNLFWLAQDLRGTLMVMQGSGYVARRISTHAIEYALSKYSTVADAVGWCYQQGGHIFYVLNLPTAQATWVYDLTTELWHERGEGGYLTSALGMHRGYTGSSAFGKNICQDYATGVLGYYDQSQFTGYGAPVKRVRTFPHLQDEDKKLVYRQFIADMAVSVGGPTHVPGVAYTLQGTAQNVVLNLTLADNVANGFFDGYTVIWTQPVTPLNGAQTIITVNGGAQYVLYSAPNVAATNATVNISAVLAARYNAALGQLILIGWTAAEFAVEPQMAAFPAPEVNLRWSDDRGYSYSGAVAQVSGVMANPNLPELTNGFGVFAPGSRNSLSWWRLGIARDRVFELSWCDTANRAINGAYVQLVGSET